MNKPLKYFDKLSLIIGEYFANEEFKKSVFDRFGTIPFASVQVSNVPFDDKGVEETTHQTKGGSEVSNNSSACCCCNYLYQRKKVTSSGRKYHESNGAESW